MPLLQLNAYGSDITLNAGQERLRPALEQALDGSGPVIIMVHGFKFSPGHPVACPHQHILSLAPERHCRKAASWPRGLGFGTPDPSEGLAIAFGWQARGAIWTAYRQAELAGDALARLITLIHTIAPERPIHAIAHSLGARVVLSAFPILQPGLLRRAILLAGAEYESRASAAMASAGGQRTEVINITSRENDLFDVMLEALIAPARRGDRALGLHMPDRPNTVTLQLDHAETLNGLSRIGFPIAPPASTICHWSSYLRDGVFALYAAALRGDSRLDMAELHRLVAQPPQPRWARMRPLPSAGLPALSGWRTAR